MTSSATRARRGIWRQALSDVLRIDWTHVEPMPALRCTVGVAAPLLAALLLHQPSAGVFIAVGSVSTGFGAFQGAYRSRATAMVLCGAGMAASLFIGSLAGHSTLAVTAVAALWGFGSGLFVALGSVASFVALQSTVAVIVAGAFPADPRGAAARAILVLAGALVHIVLVTAGTYRALDTVLGGALALLIYRVWPTWESTTLGDVLGALAAALSRDADLLLGVYVDPGRWDPEALRQAAAAARLARSNAEASVARALAEPDRDGFDPDRALGILAAFRRYVLGGLALHAGLDVRPPAAPALAPLRDQIVASLDSLAAAMRAGAPPAPLPPLRQTLVALDGAVAPAIGEQVDLMIDGLNTVAALLSA